MDEISKPDDSVKYAPQSIADVKKPRTIFKSVLILLFVFTFSAGGAFFYVSSLNEPNDQFPISQPIKIEPGTNLKTITETLEAAGVVRSKDLLYYAIVFLHDPTVVIASTYVFEEPLTTLEVAKKLVEGDFDTDLVSFTHFEGERVSLLSDRLAAKFTDFDQEEFEEKAIPLEGRLFPETYFVPNDFDHNDWLQLLSETFEEKLVPYQTEIDNHPLLTKDEIIILASIIEREANSKESMTKVASVFRNRLEIGMALQADASIEYVLDKPLSELTVDDLEIDSPYNTYINPGLPPTPIGNPGLDSIVAVLRPAETNYFFYITGKDGEFYYSETYDEHLRNIELYLR